MRMKENYAVITKYVVTAECTDPLHIGNAVGSKDEVLIHPVDNKPFIQASSIAGAFRAYYEKHCNGSEALLFGGIKYTDEGDSDSYESRIRFEDGIFLEKQGKVHLELRPHVSIDSQTGSCANSVVKGTTVNAGHKFNAEYVGAGALIQFSLYVYDESEDEEVEKIIKAFGAGEILLGGQKSNGCGNCCLKKVLRKKFHMKDYADRKLWISEDTLEEQQYENITEQLSGGEADSYAYEITMDAETEGKLLVKAIGVTDYGKDTPDVVNIRNAKKEYIVPGSSVKGAVRSRMEQIAEYLGQKDVIKDTFGYTGSKGNMGKCGNIIFHDITIGDVEQNDMMPSDHRIHIDKFTSGVMHGGLFSEKNTAGKVQIKIRIRDVNHPEKTCGLLILALRDLASGMYNLGSGYNVGKGFLDPEQITVKEMKTHKQAVIKYMQKPVCEDKDQVIASCLKSLKEV